MQNKFLIYFFSCLLLLFSCSQIDKCTQAQIDKEINNGNTDPKTLIVELNHATMINAFETAYLKSGCTGVGNGAAVNGSTLNCNVEISVFTASQSGNTIIPDQTPYFNKVYKNQPFQSTFNGTKNSTYSISVPETGAFAIEYVLTSNDCNQCCSGGSKMQCGAFGSSAGMCKEGKPKIRVLTLFMSNQRPAVEQNLIPTQFDGWGTKSCEDCDTCPEKKCY